MALEHWQLGKTALQCMGSILSDKRWTDVGFKSRDHDPDDREDCIHAHKIILSSRSPVFEAMFFGPCASDTNPLKMEEIDSEIFNLFLMYLYTDEANLTESTAPSVLQNAHMYQVTGLVEYCFKYMIQNITVKTALDLLQMALFYKEKTYEDQILKFIDDNAGLLPNECLLLILKGNTFNAREKNIFDLALKWGELQCDTKGMSTDGKTVREMLKDVFYQLCVPVMTVKEFSESTFLKGFYDFEEHERILSYIVCGGNADMLPNNNHMRYPRIDSVQIGEKTLGQSGVRCGFTTKLCGSVDDTVTILGFTIDTSKIKVLPDCPDCRKGAFSCRYCLKLGPNNVVFEGEFKLTFKEFKTSEKIAKKVNLADDEFSVKLKNPLTLKKQEGQFDILLSLQVEELRIKYFEWKQNIGSNNFENECSKTLKLSYGDTGGSVFNIYSVKSVMFENNSCRYDDTYMFDERQQNS